MSWYEYLVCPFFLASSTWVSIFLKLRLSGSLTQYQRTRWNDVDMRVNSSPHMIFGHFWQTFVSASVIYGFIVHASSPGTCTLALSCTRALIANIFFARRFSCHFVFFSNPYFEKYYNTHYILSLFSTHIFIITILICIKRKLNWFNLKVLKSTFPALF